MPGEPAVVRILRAAVASGRWDRPFLLVGRGEARDAAAESFAKAVLCEERDGGDGRACGACGACARFARGIHPDLHRLIPGKGRATVGVDAVEALQSALSLRPVEGRGAAAVVPSAEVLTPQAQNALLKTLEEPPPRTALVLTTAAPRSLLSTVRSRCVALRLPPVPRARLLADDAEEAGEAAALLARAFAPGSGARDPLEGLEPLVAFVRGKGGPLEEQRGRLRLALRILLAVHVDGRSPAALPRSAVRARLAALGEARERVERNVDPQGILEALAVAVRAGDRVPLKSGAPPGRSM